MRTGDALDALETRHAGGTVWLLSSFEPALRVELPDLYAAIVRDYRPVRRFPATVENGEITVWKPSGPPDR